eukprot:gene32031-39565_t
MTHPEYILTLSCLDQRGIVHRVSGFLAEHGCNIIDSAQFGDAESQLFFMRVHFSLDEPGVNDELDQVLDLLVAHPSTARFVSRKLAQYFLADQPPAEIVDRMAVAFQKSN